MLFLTQHLLVMYNIWQTIFLFEKNQLSSNNYTKSLSYELWMVIKDLMAWFVDITLRIVDSIVQFF